VGPADREVLIVCDCDDCIALRAALGIPVGLSRDDYRIRLAETRLATRIPEEAS
jgi:hypothetical protein